MAKPVFVPSPEQLQEKRRIDRETEQSEFEKQRETCEGKQKRRINIWPLSITHFKPFKTSQYIITFDEPFPVDEFVRRMELAFKDI